MAENNVVNVPYYRNICLEMDDVMVTFIVDVPTYEAIVLRRDAAQIEKLKKAYKDVLNSGGIPDDIKGCSKPTEIDVCDNGDSMNVSEDATSSKVSVQMPHRAVLLLIEIYRKNSAKMVDKKTAKKTIWQKIASELQEKGFKFDWLQIKNKYNNLLRNYRQTKDHNNKTGREPKKCPFFDELDDFLGTKPNTRPDIIVESPIDDDNDILDESSASTVVEAESESVTQPPKRSRMASPKKSKITKALDMLQDKRDSQHNEFMSEIQKQHKEFMETEEKKITLLERLIDKF